MRLLLNILKQTGSQEPINTNTRKIQITGVDGIIIGIIIGVTLTLITIYVINSIKKHIEQKNKDKNNK